MSCPGSSPRAGLLGRSGRAKMAKPAVVVTKTRACATWGERDAEQCPEGGKAFGARNQEITKTRGRRELGSLAGPGGIILSGVLGAFWPFPLAFSL